MTYIYIIVNSDIFRNTHFWKLCRLVYQLCQKMPVSEVISFSLTPTAVPLKCIPSCRGGGVHRDFMPAPSRLTTINVKTQKNVFF